MRIHSDEKDGHSGFYRAVSLHQSLCYKRPRVSLSPRNSPARWDYVISMLQMRKWGLERLNHCLNIMGK